LTIELEVRAGRGRDVRAGSTQTKSLRGALGGDVVRRDETSRTVEGAADGGGGQARTAGAIRTTAEHKDERDELSGDAAGAGMRRPSFEPGSGILCSLH
jgi:hypothetical protein